MAKTKRVFQIFSAAEPINPNGKDPNANKKSKSQTTNTMNSQNNDTPALYPTSAGVQTNEEQPQNNDNMYPLEVQREQANESKDEAKEFKKNLPHYKSICEKVMAADEVENNAGVEPLMPPVIS